MRKFGGKGTMGAGGRKIARRNSGDDWHGYQTRTLTLFQSLRIFRPMINSFHPPSLPSQPVPFVSRAGIPVLEMLTRSPAKRGVES